MTRAGEALKLEARSRGRAGAGGFNFSRPQTRTWAWALVAFVSPAIMINLASRDMARRESRVYENLEDPGGCHWLGSFSFDIL